MNNKKGFTLVELIAVITIIALIIVLVVPGIAESSRKSKYRSYLTKLESVRSGAILYGQDNYAILKNNAEKGINGCEIETQEGIDYRTCKITFGSLIPDYLVPDLEEPNPKTGGRFEDPRNTQDTLDDYIVKIKIDPTTRKVTADIDEEQNP